LIYAKTKQREIEELKKAEAFRREFIADVSHELKTPIFAAQGFVHTLLDGAVKDKNVRNRFLKKAAKSLDGLDRIVQDLLTISQVETGVIKMEMENFNINILIGKYLISLKKRLIKRMLI
jgi:two-component system phosphate regulon sensor histidine kinase PhoR